MDIHEVRQMLRYKTIYEIPLRVTYYARVSSDSDEQLNSLSNQVAYYEDLIRKNMGISILARSACMDELRKGKLTALPIENLSMVRQTNILYHKDFHHPEILQAITRLYREAAKIYG